MWWWWWWCRARRRCGRKTRRQARREMNGLGEWLWRACRRRAGRAMAQTSGRRSACRRKAREKSVTQPREWSSGVLYRAPELRHHTSAEGRTDKGEQGLGSRAIGALRPSVAGARRIKIAAAPLSPPLSFVLSLEAGASRCRCRWCSCCCCCSQRVRRARVVVPAAQFCFLCLAPVDMCAACCALVARRAGYGATAALRQGT